MTEQEKELQTANFRFICDVCNYINANGSKLDKKWLEEKIWDLFPAYKNVGKDELGEHLLAQVTDCIAWTTQDK